MLTAIILAGGQTKEALLPIGQRYMVEYVVDALKENSRIKRIIMVGAQKELRELYHNHSQILCLQGGKTILESLSKGVIALDQSIPPGERILVVTADIPLLTAEIVDHFLAVSPPDYDLCYPIVTKESIQRKFPESKRTYVHFREGVFTGGNLFLVNPQIVLEHAARAEELISYRKSPLKLVKFIGLKFLIKYLWGSLTLKEVESRVSLLFKIKGKALIVDLPEIAVDVDKSEDLELVKKFIL